MNDGRIAVKRWWDCFYYYCVIFEVLGDYSMCQPFDLRGCHELITVLGLPSMKHPPESLIKCQEKIYSYPGWNLTSHFLAGQSIAHVLKRSLLTEGMERKIELRRMTGRSPWAGILSSVSSLICGTSYNNVIIMAMDSSLSVGGLNNNHIMGGHVNAGIFI